MGNLLYCDCGKVCSSCGDECVNFLCCGEGSEYIRPPAKTGELLKQGKYTKNWNKRWLDMEDGFIAYYESKGPDGNGRNLRNYIDLRSFQLDDNTKNSSDSKNLSITFVARSRNSERGQYVIDGLISPSTTYDFTAPNGATKREWVQAIEQHIQYWKDKPRPDGTFHKDN